MSVLPQPRLDDFHQFLLACQAKLSVTQPAQLVSLTLNLTQDKDPIDPLLALDHWATAERHFYFENGDRRTAILALGSVLTLETSGSQRFCTIRDWIRQHSTQIRRGGDTATPFAGPHWFCNFSFFDGPRSKSESDWPSGSVFLPQWHLARQGDRCTLVANLNLRPETNVAKFMTQLHDQWSTLQRPRSTPPSQKPSRQLSLSLVTPSAHFRQAVTSALTAIGNRLLHKIVLAQALDVTSPIPFEPMVALHNLRQRHPGCCIYSTGLGASQTFLGASPERLAAVYQHQLVTDALAGSTPRGKTLTEDAQLAEQLLSSPKERHEHQVVVDFIATALGDLGLEPQRSPVRLLQLDNIQHLHTTIVAALPPALHLLDVVAALHPTPAVAGVPQQLACEQIRCYETFDRTLYAAPIGWVDGKGNGEFAVGIRSAHIDGSRARLFAGAGIVAGSTPDREWAEVELKLQTLLLALT